jgi:carboxyl-terminal processing protease
VNFDDERPTNPEGASDSTNPESDRAGGAAPADRPVWSPPPAGWPQPPQPGWSPPGAWPSAQGGWQGPPSAWPGGPQPGWTPPSQGWAPQPGWQPQQPGWQPQQPGWQPQQPGWQPAIGTAPESTGSKASQPRRSRLPQIVVVAGAILIAFSAGVLTDRAAGTQTPGQSSTPAASPSQPLDGFGVYEEALKDIRSSYVGRDSVTDKQLLYGSIKGMVDSLGDTNHTRFLTPEEYAAMTSQLSGKVAGIGVLLNQENGTTTVQRVIPDSPADKAGMKAGDTIVAVDGKSTAGATFDELAAEIRGDPGTKVTITVIHAGSTAQVDIDITRAVITAPLVDWGMVPGTTVADIALYEFSDGAADQIETAIAAASKAGATAIVLDLRGNPGGLADEARSVASEFLSSGVIYQEEDASGKRTSIKADRSWTATTLPMVVLVDHDTASAAEIVAGALQDNGRARVIGVTTVGTGTVLQPFVLSDGSVLLLGVADWLTPLGHRIFGVGITPDQTVAMPTGGQPIDPINLEGMSALRMQSSSDSQLLAAVKALGQ